MTHFHRALITATFASVTALAAPAALAQAPADPTIYVVTYIEVMPAATAEAAGLASNDGRRAAPVMRALG